jgi:hypothetical protein
MRTQLVIWEQRVRGLFPDHSPTRVYLLTKVLLLFRSTCTTFFSHKPQQSAKAPTLLIAKLLQKPSKVCGGLCSLCEFV